MIVPIQVISGSFGTLEKRDASSGKKMLLMTGRRKVLLSFTRLEQIFLIGCVFPQEDTIGTYSCTHATSPVAVKTHASNRYRFACCPRETVRTPGNGDQQKERKEKKSPYERSKIPFYLRVFCIISNTRPFFYLFPSTARLSHRELTSAGISYKSCGARGKDKRNTLRAIVSSVCQTTVVLSTSRLHNS